MKLTLKQEKFVEEYIKTGNATEAARRAGYSEGTAIEASTWLNPRKPHKFKPHLQQAINQRMKEIEKGKTATPEEIIQFLSQSMRGEIIEEVVVVESRGEGYSSAEIVKKQIGAKDRLKAAELLLKRYPRELDVEEQQLRNAKLKAEVAAIQDTGQESVVIIDDVPEEG